MNAHDIAYALEMAGKSPLLQNSRLIIGTGIHCPRCLLRGTPVRWFPVRAEEFQVSRCSECSYEVRDR